jgi:hypothetical protein
MRQCFSGFTRDRLVAWIGDEDGAVTTDWVVLIAGIVTMAFIVLASITGGAQVYAANTGAELAARNLGAG